MNEIINSFGFSFSAMAQENGIMGLYWDLEGSTQCMQAEFGFADLYFILMNPTHDTLDGFECNITIVVTHLPYLTAATFANSQALTVSTFPNFIVGFGSPTICTPATLLVTLEVLNIAGVDLAFFLHQSDPPSIPGDLPAVLWGDGTLEQVATPTPVGYPDALALVGGCGVATEETTWDSVKSLYR